MSGPTITVAVIADTDEARRDLGKLEGSLEEVGDTAGRQGSRVGDGIGSMTEKADESERKFRGLGDTVGGTGDVMRGFKDGDVVGVAMGLADLAGGIADFVGPALTKMATKLGLVTTATEVQTVAQEESNIAMSLNPIGIVVLALVALAAAFYVAWTKSETFRQIVTGAFDAVVGAAQYVWHWIDDNWPYLLAILAGPFAPLVLGLTVWRDDIGRIVGEVPEKIRSALSTVEGILKAPFTLAKVGIDSVASAVPELFSGIGATVARVIKAPINAVIDGINAVQVHIHIDIPHIGGIGFDWGGMNLPHLALGGIAVGPQAVVVGDNPSRREAIVPLEPGILRMLGGGGDVYVTLPRAMSPADAFDAVERYRRRQGAT